MFGGWKVSALFWKEVVHFFREPGVRNIFLIIPILSAPLLFGLIMETALLVRSNMLETPAKICIVGGKRPAQMKQLEDGLSKYGTLTVCNERYPDTALENGAVDAVLTINPVDDRVSVCAKDNPTAVRVRNLLLEAQNDGRAAALAERNLQPSDLSPFYTTVRYEPGKDLKVSPEAVTAGVALVFCTLCIGGIITVILIGEFDHLTIETTLVQPNRRLVLFGKALAATAIILTPLVLATISFLIPCGVFVACGTLSMPPINFMSLPILALTVLTIGVYTALIDMYIVFLMRGAKLSSFLMNFANNFIILMCSFSLAPFVPFVPFTACIPVLNICLAAKSIVDGHNQYLLCSFSFLVMFFCCFLALLLAEQQFTLDDAMTTLAIRVHKIFNFRGSKQS